MLSFKWFNTMVFNSSLPSPSSSTQHHDYAHEHTIAIQSTSPTNQLVKVLPPKTGNLQEQDRAVIKGKAQMQRVAIANRQINLDPETLELIGSGSFHKAYKIEPGLVQMTGTDYQGPWVYKVRYNNHDGADPMDILNTPERSVRLFTEISPHMPVAIFQDGYIMPYFKTSPEVDQSNILREQRRLYEQSDRILMDPISDNFSEDGQLIDPNHALRPDSPTSLEVIKRKGGSEKMKIIWKKDIWPTLKPEVAQQSEQLFERLFLSTTKSSSIPDLPA